MITDRWRFHRLFLNGRSVPYWESRTMGDPIHNSRKEVPFETVATTTTKTSCTNSNNNCNNNRTQQLWQQKQKITTTKIAVTTTKTSNVYIFTQSVRFYQVGPLSPSRSSLTELVRFQPSQSAINQVGPLSTKSVPYPPCWSASNQVIPF